MGKCSPRSSNGTFLSHSISDKGPPWVEPACPCYLVLGAAGAPASSSSNPGLCPETSICFMVSQTTAPWTEVKSVPMTEFQSLKVVFRGCERCFGPRGRESQKSLAPGQARVPPVQHHVALQPSFCSHVCEDLFRPLSKALWARSTDLTSVPGGLVCNHSPIGHLLGSAAHSSPTTHAKTGRAAQVSATQVGTHPTVV